MQGPSLLIVPSALILTLSWSVLLLLVDEAEKAIAEAAKLSKKKTLKTFIDLEISTICVWSCLPNDHKLDVKSENPKSARAKS